jgi:hypothetical protein
MTTKEPTTCDTPKPGAPGTICNLKRGHHGAHDWSWLRKINERVPRPDDHSITKEEMQKQRRIAKEAEA